MRKEPQNSYKIESLIGKGSFASVYRAKCLADHSSVAIKIISIQRLGNTSLTAALNEVRILSSVDSPYVVKYLESFVDKTESQLWIVMELLEGGDFGDLINESLSSKIELTEKQVWIYFIQCLMGLKALHKLGIIHRDLKPKNIFLTRNRNQIKIGDMNVSKILDKAYTRTMVGSPGYLAPEIWRSQPYNLTCDSFSLGCTIFEIASGQLPFSASTLPELKANILNNPPLRLPIQYSQDLQNVIEKCLTKISSVRPTADQILNDATVRRKIRDLGITKPIFQPSKALASLIEIPKNKLQLNQSLPGISRSQSPLKRPQLDVKPKLGKTYITVLKTFGSVKSNYMCDKVLTKTNQYNSLCKSFAKSSKNDIPSPPSKFDQFPLTPALKEGQNAGKDVSMFNSLGKHPEFDSHTSIYDSESREVKRLFFSNMYNLKAAHSRSRSPTREHLPVLPMKFKTVNPHSLSQNSRSP
jgi:serine/threonine protein kinase